MPDAAPAPVATSTPAASQPAADQQTASRESADLSTSGTTAASTSQSAADSGAAKPPEGEKPEGEKAEPAGETREQKLARLSAAGKAARRAAARARELAAQNQRLQQQAHSASQAAQSTQQSVERLRQLAQSDPYAFAKELGLDPKRLVEGAVRDGSPEAQLEQRIKAAEERAAQAEARAQQWEEGQKRAHQQAMVKQAHEAFAKESGDATVYPNISRLPLQARVSWAQELLREDFVRARQMLTPEQLAQYRPTNSQLLKAMERLAASNGTPSSTPKAPTDSSPAAKPEGSTTPQTVSAALSSAKYTKPANFDDLSDAEQKAHLARMMEDIVPGAKKKKR